MLNVDGIVESPSYSFQASYNQRDLIIYAIGIGSSDLQFTYEDHEHFAAFPLYPCVLPFKGTSNDVIPFPPPTLMNLPSELPPTNPANILHGEQFLEVIRPLNPVGGTLECVSKVISFLDKRTGAFMETETLVSDTNGPVARMISGGFIRGLTGFVSKGRVQPPRVKIPKREPDFVDIEKTSPHQAQLFRLSGDYNPLHIDPSCAKSVGLKAPILHGLCALGFGTRALYNRLCHGDTGRFKSIRVRFTNAIIPGDVLETQTWMENTCVYFRILAKERNKVIIDGGEFVFLAEPAPKL